MNPLNSRSTLQVDYPIQKAADCRFVFSILFSSRTLEHNYNGLRSHYALLHFVCLLYIHRHDPLSVTCRCANLQKLSTLVVCCSCLLLHHRDLHITSYVDGLLSDHFCCGHSPRFIPCTLIYSCIYFLAYLVASVLRHLLPGLEAHQHPKQCSNISCQPVHVDGCLYIYDADKWS